MTLFRRCDNVLNSVSTLSSFIPVVSCTSSIHLILEILQVLRLRSKEKRKHTLGMGDLIITKEKGEQFLKCAEKTSSLLTSPEGNVTDHLQPCHNDTWDFIIKDYLIILSLMIFYRCVWHWLFLSRIIFNYITFDAKRDQKNRKRRWLIFV